MKLGKIKSARFGVHPDSSIFGLFLWFQFDGVESDLHETNMDAIKAILKDAQCNFVDQLSGKPVEVFIENNTLVKFRILKEVL